MDFRLLLTWDWYKGKNYGEWQRDVAPDFRHGRGQEHLTPAASGVTLPAAVRRPNLLIDIQAKIQQGYGAGFEHYAAIHNIKEMAKTLLFLQERGLDNYDLITEKTAEVSANFSAKSVRI